MKWTARIPVLLTFLLAAGAAVLGASHVVALVEDRSAREVRVALLTGGLDWAQVNADGLRLALTGTAPDEAARFRAAAVAGTVIDADRVVDRMEVERREPIAPPRFSVEILRQHDGVTLIGLVPAEIDRQELLDDVARAAFETPITDLLETASYPAPEGWVEALDYGVTALKSLERAKVSIAAERVAIVTMAEDGRDREKLERELRRRAPDAVKLVLEISAPRPVITPYTLRIVRSAEGTSFDACSAPDDAAARRILASAREAEVPETEECTIGLGVPSPAWTETAERAIGTLGALPAGALTMSNLSIRIEAGEGTDAGAFEKLSAALGADLPEEFTLTAILGDAGEVAREAGPAEFTATRSPEGLVNLRGRLGTERSRAAVDSFARSRFGNGMVGGSIDINEAVPPGWGPRVLASLDALAMLSNGSAIVGETRVDIRGTTGTRGARAEIARILSGQLGDTPTFAIDVTYDERLDPVLSLPTPEECASGVNGILSERQITFAPGSGEIDAASRDSIDAIAEVLRQCEGIRMEVAGFTDSQGGEEMNQRLSESRAEALLSALMARRVVTSDLSAKGYGEETPIADNATEAGREANRRIEFRLLLRDRAVPHEEAAQVGEAHTHE